MPWMQWSWGLLPPLQRLDWVINVPTYALACCSEFTGTLFNAPKKHQVNIKSYAKRWQKQHEGKLPQTAGFGPNISQKRGPGVHREWGTRPGGC